VLASTADLYKQGRLHHGGSGGGCPLPLSYGGRGMPFITRQVILHQKSKSRGQFVYKEQYSCNFVHWSALDAKHRPNSVSGSLTTG